MKYMNFKNLLIFILCLTFGSLNAQLPNGSIAPNFKAIDIDGVEHDLYEILQQGKSVILDFSATWCPPCWSYHESGALHDFMESYGPEGSDEAMVFYIECDITTSLEDLNGTGNNTQGDWVDGTNYPIIDKAYIANLYQIGSYPTIMMVCPDRLVQNVGTQSSDNLYSQIGNCPSIDVKPAVSFSADNTAGCNELEVGFLDNSWPVPNTYLWDFGDDQTSTEANPSHQYTEIGEYTVTLKVSNEFGESEDTKTNFVLVGEGESLENMKVGPENKDIGAGAYFPGGHQGLIFDAEKDIFISSVKVFSDREELRTVSVHDALGNLLTTRDVMVSEGEQRIDLDIFVAQGTDYRIGLHSNAYMFRNSAGCDYPYSVDNLVSITKSTASAGNELLYYYYFYDWEVREAGCSGIVNNEDLELKNFSVFPNPTFDQITIESSVNLKPIIYSAIGQELKLPMTVGTESWIVDMSSLTTGMYYIQVGKSVQSINKM